MAKDKNALKNITVVMERAVYGALAEVGEETTTFLKKAMREPDENGNIRSTSGKLEGSFTYGTMGVEFAPISYSRGATTGNPVLARLGNAAEVEDIITPVKTKYTVKIGTRVKYAKYVDGGSAPHGGGGAGGDEFVENMREWGADKGLTEQELQGVMKHIQLNGTKPHPFMGGATLTAKNVAKKTFSRAWNSAAKTLKPVVTTITVKGTRAT